MIAYTYLVLPMLNLRLPAALTYSYYFSFTYMKLREVK